eukprot:4489362-Pyramimonas_sp.AAC.1
MYPRVPEIDRRRPVSDVAPHVAEADWKRIFALLLEVDNEMPARYVAQEGRRPKLTQIGRIFLSSQSWEAIQWTMSVSITPDFPEFPSRRASAITPLSCLLWRRGRRRIQTLRVFHRLSFRIPTMFGSSRIWRRKLTGILSPRRPSG